MKVYKVRDRNTGEFSTGGHCPKFTKTGKSWSKAADITMHVNQASELLSRTVMHPYYGRDIEVIEYELFENEKSAVPMREWVRAAALRKVEKQESFQRKREAFRQKLRRAEYERLKKEFES